MSHFIRNKVCFILFLIPFFSQAQPDLDKRRVNINPGSYTIHSALDIIEELNEITVSYNSSAVDSSFTFSFAKDRYLLKDVLNYLLRDYQYNVISYSSERLVLKITSYKRITVSGFIYDDEKGDNLYGALVEDVNTGDVVYTNDNGFYSMEVNPGRVQLRYRYLGYEEKFYSDIITRSRSLNLSLVNNNLLTPVLITSDHAEGLPVRNSGVRVRPESVQSFGSVAGVDDLVNRIRYLPGVQSGSEGVGGLFIRGGSNDQNLYLYDGVPMYEISHTAGISSIFNNESIQNIEVFRYGFPAKYSGRLSSIVDVKIKEGNQNKTEGSFTVGNYGPNLTVSGPLLTEKLTYNLTARTSWMHWYINPLIGDVIDYDDVDIRFTDINLKLAWHLNSRHKITLTNYYGSDILNLDNETTNLGGPISFRLREKNSISWNSYLTSLNYVGTLNDKLQISAKLGTLNYEYQNRGAYSFRNFSLDNAFLDEIDVISRSNIDDILGGVRLDYFLNDDHFVSIGSDITRHAVTPTLRQSTILLGTSDIDQISDNASEIDAVVNSYYYQQKSRFGKNVLLDFGLNATNFKVRETNYFQLQPRFSATIGLPSNSTLKLSYSRMGQFVHVLVNPGLGLPSNLWVPSTENIQPELSDQINISLNRKLNSNIRLNLDGYYKWSEGLLEYRLADGLYSTILNNDGFVPIFNEDKDWEENIEIGSGTMRGLEFFIEGTHQSFSYWLSYTWSKSDRQFNEINQGEAFPYKYDRRHDINLGMVKTIKDGKTIGANWVYGSGTAFTLAIESFPSIDGIELLNPGNRNNYRLPSFHHLDVFYEYKNLHTQTPFSIKIGIYNIYNQLNPYYVILYNDPVENRPILKQVSIFPIFPYVNFRTTL
ncbi:MAG: TonB-dependent receptor plug domain-containing protein [Saprospiraceae bacterium]|nr:TonB-dependent receptor plug domain-containing protein [Saprospiraceae bacterium]